MHRTLAAFLVTAALLFSSASFADSGAPTKPEREPEQTSWYGWEIAVADAISVAEVLTTGSLGQGELATVGVSTYLILGPVIHIGHGRGAMAAASFGMRVGLPVVAAAAGLAIGGVTAHKTCTPSSADITCDDGWAGLDVPLEGAAIGLLIGTVAASAIDVALLSHEKVTTKTPPVSVAIRRTQGGAALSMSMVW